MKAFRRQARKSGAARVEETPAPLRLDSRSVLDKIICSTIWHSVTLTHKEIGADSETLSIEVNR